jgi:hypothetical protein
MFYRIGRVPLICLGFMLTMTIIYLTMYMALSEPKELALLSSPPILVKTQAFRFGGKASEFFFAPVTWLDKLLRPSFWLEEFKRAPLNEPVSTTPFDF